MGRRLRNRLRKIVRREGFTLVEVLVAALLLVFAMAGIVPFFASALAHSSLVRDRSVATNIARQAMEQIRQLDYREIVDTDQLTGLYGGTFTERGVTYQVECSVSAPAEADDELLKTVTVTVSREGSVESEPVSMSTMFHQQFVGPRIERLALSMSYPDPLGTPFRVLYEWTTNTLTIYVAQPDWGLVLDNLDEPDMSARDVYARLYLVDANGQSLALGDPDDDYRLINLHYTTDDTTGLVNQVYFTYTFDSGSIPDGYWEFRALVYNEYDEPGNVWRLRTRVENDHPAAPTQFVAVPEVTNDGVQLYWVGGAERDRAYYELQRRKWVGPGPDDFSGWVTIGPDVDPNATTYGDPGSATTPSDPWGSETTTNVYQYRIRAVDICNPPSYRWGPYASVEVAIPSTTTTVLGEETTTTLAVTTTLAGTTTSTAAVLSTVMIDNKTTKVYNLLIQGDNGYPDLNTTVNKKTVKTISNLPAGNYLITATSSGRPTLKQSFTVPEPSNGQIVMTIL